jgi:hypothetical protein
LEEGRLVMRRTRGNTMAFYAAFILFVGVPLMALTWDIGRLRAAQAKLSVAAEAGCAAYVSLANADAWSSGGSAQFNPNGQVAALGAFYNTAPPESTLFITPLKGAGDLLKAHCTARTTVHPFIDIGLGDYHATVYADAKADWVFGPFPK